MAVPKKGPYPEIVELCLVHPKPKPSNALPCPKRFPNLGEFFGVPNKWSTMTIDSPRFDMWQKTPKSGRWDWQLLKEKLLG